MKHLLLAACFGAAIAACSPQEAKTQAAEAPVQQAERTIDWGAAHKDANVQPPPIAATAPKSNFNPKVTTASVGAPVPMLAPPVQASVAAGLDDGAVTVRVTEDGYFITVPGPRYDVIVNGTKAFYLAPSDAPKTPAKAAPQAYRFEWGEGEATLAFSRYGADYLIQFVCKTGAANAACMTQADAVAFAERLQLVNQ
jgi:hypothetical protein